MPSAALALSTLRPWGPAIIYILAIIAGVREGGVRSAGRVRAGAGRVTSKIQSDTDDIWGTPRIAHSTFF